MPHGATTRRQWFWVLLPKHRRLYRPVNASLWGHKRLVIAQPPHSLPPNHHGVSNLPNPSRSISSNLWGRSIHFTQVIKKHLLEGIEGVVCSTNEEFSGFFAEAILGDDFHAVAEEEARMPE